MNINSKPKIRQKTVAVPVKRPAPVSAASSASSPALSRKSSSLNAGTRPAPPSNRYQLTPSTKSRPSPSTTQNGGARQLSVSRVQRQQKRKVTPTTPQWGNSSSDEDSEDESSLRKRQKTSSSVEPLPITRMLEPDPHRRIRRQNGTPGKGETPLRHGLAMTRGEWVKDFKLAFPDTKGDRVVELQYPSALEPEQFETVVPYDNSNFNPIDDICFTIDEIVQHFLPPNLAAELRNVEDGTVALLRRAVKKNTPFEFEVALREFNNMMKAKVDDGTIAKVMDEKHALPLSLTRRILAQVYQRTVSPFAHKLSKDARHDKKNTYGELLPDFCHTIFNKTGLNSSHVFVDLGSGVGNVVLQSALQTGAESWGIEIMPRACKYAAQQADELKVRSRLWNIALGPVKLLSGDFLESPDVDKLLPRADVILVNNKVFGEAVNGRLLDKFLDLKLGCKVVSLASFGGSGKQSIRNEQSIANLFDEERFDSGANSVSWADASVEYCIATKAR
ncbi:DOT1-domain-containing protein [Polyplosphaeria fusca]|uniref:Histone-lysine N-methyltransferase, H3 lysine-79 specific n=1 Tax=Polyplosphaeria fusca TaxID=682080 RepID=A0A9P4QTI7_9PLEO|nr:DOT1-domain-containing protein [Polyplosphaeria fusca]